MQNYVVIRIATKSDGTISAPTYGADTEVNAWKQFYRICGQAVDSEHPYDAAVLLDKYGGYLDGKYFVHEQPAPEPEPESEPEPEPDPTPEEGE